MVKQNWYIFYYGTRAREAKRRDARAISPLNVSLDGLAERTNRHLG